MNQTLPNIALELIQSHKARQARKRLAAQGVPQEPYSYDRRVRKAVRTVYADNRINYPVAPPAKDLIKVSDIAYYRIVPVRCVSERDDPYVCENCLCESCVSARAKKANTLNQLPTLTELAEWVSHKYGVSISDLRGASRSYFLRQPRFEFAYMAKHNRVRSLNEVGRYLGRDHTTILHSIKRYQALQKAKISGEDCVISRQFDLAKVFVLPHGRVC